MPESAEMCLRTTRSSIVKPVRALPERRPSSAIPRFTEMKISVDDEARHPTIESPHVAPQTMAVYLRLKPRSAKSKRVKKVQDDTYVVLDQTTLLTKFPSLEGTANPTSRSKSPDATGRKFNFTAIFGPEISQSEFFDRAIKQRVVDFLAGQSCTLMSYGTTNTGKSYTFHGNVQAPGVVPRTIEFVFSGVDCTLSPWYKPTNVSEVVSLEEAGRIQEAGVRESLLASRSMDRTICEEAYGSLANSMREDREVGSSGEAMYSVWLSFMEIYNENIYDLLVDDESQVNNKTTPLRLVKDKHGRAFVQGLRTISATTGTEAYRIFTAGQSRLTVGSTNLNPQASRSHSIFTIKLLRYTKERAPQEVEISTMTFCDLAGTGRSRTSAGAGSELKETKNINTSLLVLGRCLKGISECQTSRQSVEVVGPFRESKLTRLFERVLTGKENLAMIVNVDTSPELYVETLSVLNFSAIAKKIVIQSGRDPKGVSDLTAAGRRATEMDDRERPASCGVIEPSIARETANKSDSQKVDENNVALTKEIAILRETALNREFEIRTEMADLYGGMIKNLEANWSKRTKDAKEEQDDYLKWSVKQIENFYRERIDSLTNRKRRRTSGGDHKDDGKTLFEELESENAGITAKLVALRETIKKLKEEQETLSADKNKCVFELGLVKDELRQVRQLINDERGENVIIHDNTKVVDDLRSLIAEKNERIKSLQSKLSCQTTGVTNSSNLELMTTAELEEELRKRNQRARDAKQEQQLLMSEKPMTAECDKDIYAKFSSLTFKKEISGLATISPRKYVDNSVDEASIEDSAMISSCPSLNPPMDESMSNLHSSFLETIDKVFRSSDESAINDSGYGVASNRMSSSTECETEEKGCQTSFDILNANANRNHDLRQEQEEKLELDHDSCIVVANNRILSCTECETEDKGCQTTFDVVNANNDRINDLRQERVEQLKLDYTQLTAELFHETLRATEFSQKLEYIQHTVGELKQITTRNDEKIIDYQEQLAARESDLENLEQTKTQLEAKLRDISKQLESMSVAYERKIDELRAELKLCEESESRMTKSLEEHRRKSVAVENELSVARVQLDECFTRHVPRIERLEKELVEKTARVNELDEKILQCERDAERVTELNGRVTDFARTFDDYQSERDELRRQLLQRLETQSTLEYKLKRLTSKVHERENEISLLRTDLGDVVRVNMENSERARELSKEITVAIGKLASAKGEMARSEDERRKLERISGHEIGSLIARLADFEKNATLVARLRDNEDSRVDELDRLKLLLHEKDREMSLFKKNRDKTIRRYEALIRKLQADVEAQCNRKSSKLRMLYPKKAMSKDSVKSVESFRWRSTLVESVKRTKSSRGLSTEKTGRNQYQSAGREADRKWPLSFPTCSRCSTLIKRTSSQALVTSTTSLEDSRSSGSKVFPIPDDDDDDEDECVESEIIETESHADLNLDIVESLGYRRRESSSQAAATFSIPSTSDDSRTDFQTGPGWMEIRRTNGRTHFRIRKGDSDV